jgi:predicted metal-dependent hydrolase
MEILVKAPLHTAKAQIDDFVGRHAQWIAKQMERLKNAPPPRPEPTTEEAAQMKREAQIYLSQRVKYFAEQMKLSPAGIKITSGKYTLGSCNRKNGLCFSYRLMWYPGLVVDYVVVHELAHIPYKNHGTRFYQLIASILPDYRTRIRMMKEHLE